MPKLDMVTLALLATVKTATPVELAAMKIGVEGKVVVPWTERVAIGLLLPIPTKPLALTVR